MPKSKNSFQRLLIFASSYMTSYELFYLDKKMISFFRQLRYLCIINSFNKLFSLPIYDCTFSARQTLYLLCFSKAFPIYCGRFRVCELALKKRLPTLSLAYKQTVHIIYAPSDFKFPLSVTEDHNLLR